MMRPAKKALEQRYPQGVCCSRELDVVLWQENRRTCQCRMSPSRGLPVGFNGLGGGCPGSRYLRGWKCHTLYFGALPHVLYLSSDFTPTYAAIWS